MLELQFHRNPWVRSGVVGRLGALVLFGLVSACAGGSPGSGLFQRKEVVFPEGLEPLEESTALAPEGDDFPEDVVFVTGESEDYVWAHGRGYLHTGLDEIWSALQVEEILVNRRAVDEWEVEADVVPDFDASYRIHNLVHDIVTVEYQVDWRQGLEEEGEETAGLVAARFAKTDGTPFISLMEGSLVFWRVDESVVEMEQVWHLRAAQENPEYMTEFMEDLFTEVKAHAQGEPLPEYDEVDGE